MAEPKTPAAPSIETRPARRRAPSAAAKSPAKAKAAPAAKAAKATKPAPNAARAARPAAMPTRAKPPLAAPPRAKPARKPRKVRAQLVRDGFTMPEADFGLLAMLKSRALAFGRVAKKSELLRAGLHALAAIDSPGLVAALDQLEPVKIGRPKKSA